jgi:two-component sensor histidine kinase
MSAQTSRRGLGLIKRLIQLMGGTLTARTDEGALWTLNSQ